jgi:hypothetical protein
MNGGINDAVIIGVVLCLLFSAVSYYLYSRATQLEKKVGYMENILLDFKTTFEQTVMDLTNEAPAPIQASPAGITGLTESETQTTQEDEFVPATEDVRQVQLEPTRTRPVTTASPVQIVRDEKTVATVTANYEANTYKELLQIAKQKGVTGGSHMTKGELIAAIRRKDSGQPVKEAPATWTAFMESQGQPIQGTPISMSDDEKADEEGVLAEPLDGADSAAPLDDDESFVE